MTKSMERGKLIVLDGTDGSGKETQTKLLEERLNSEGIHVIKYTFPNYDTIFGQMITEYLDGEYGPTTSLHPKMASILYAFDRWKVAEEIRGHLEKGIYVLCDRYVESNMGYQQTKLPPENRDEFFNWLNTHFELSSGGGKRIGTDLYFDPKSKLVQQGEAFGGYLAYFMLKKTLQSLVKEWEKQN